MAPVTDIVETLDSKFPCRKSQLIALVTLCAPSFPTPPALVLHGLEATGKTTIIKAVLETVDVPHVIIDSNICITGRHLLEKTATACHRKAREIRGTGAVAANQTRCDSLNTLENHLEKSLRGIQKFVLVFDGIDRQRESPLTLLPALARFGSIIPQLSVIFIVSVPSPRLLQLPGVPHVHFTTYTKDESVKILSLNPPDIFVNPVDESLDYGEEEAAEDKAWLWPRFCNVVWDSVAKGAARDLKTFTSVCFKLWRPFVQPIIDGNFGTRDFTKLLVARRSIFQSEDFLSGTTVMKRHGDATDAKSKTVAHELPYYTKFLLCAAYLASFNPPRQDHIFFMRSTDRKRRRRGGAVGGRTSKTRKIPRHLLNPSPFPLDRLLAILHAILPHNFVNTSQVYAQIATLASLRLLLRTGGAGADILDPAARFRVNCSWEYVSTLGRSVSLEMRDYLAT